MRFGSSIQPRRSEVELPYGISFENSELGTHNPTMDPRNSIATARLSTL